MRTRGRSLLDEYVHVITISRRVVAVAVIQYTAQYNNSPLAVRGDRRTWIGSIRGFIDRLASEMVSISVTTTYQRPSLSLFITLLVQLAPRAILQRETIRIMG